jgi:hypothetical protein
VDSGIAASTTATIQYGTTRAEKRYPLPADEGYWSAAYQAKPNARHLGAPEFHVRGYSASLSDFTLNENRGCSAGEADASTAPKPARRPTDSPPALEITSHRLSLDQSPPVPRTS